MNPKREKPEPLRVRALQMSCNITLVAGAGFEPATFGV